MRRTLNSLTVREVRLVVKAAVALLEARYRLRRTSVVQMRGWASLLCSVERGMVSREPLLRAFRLAAGRLGGTCLVRALALQYFLSRHGHASELRIGVARSEKGFEAHAWLIDGDEILEGGGQALGEFTLLASWPSEQAPS